MEWNKPYIVVGDNGWVWYSPKVTVNGDWITLHDAQCIESWGTTQGLAELRDGPTATTRLSMPNTKHIHIFTLKVLEETILWPVKKKK